MCGLSGRRVERRRESSPAALAAAGAGGQARRVLFAASTLEVGGAELHFLALIDGLRRFGFEPRVMLLKKPGAVGRRLIAAGDVPVDHGLKSRGVTPGLLRRVYALLRDRRPHTLVTLDHDDVMLVARLAARLARIPRVVTLMHTTNRADGSSSVPWLVRATRSLSDLYVASAQGHRDYLAAHGLPRERIAVVMPAVDTERFLPRPGDPKLRESLGLGGAWPVLGMVALLRPEKNHELAVEAFLLIRRQFPEARLLFVGDGPRRPLVEAKVCALGLQPAVRFLGLREDTELILPQLDLTLLTSEPRVETFPAAVLEAMACGCAVVATDVGSLSEVVDSGVDGVLVPSGSAMALAAAAGALLRDGDKRRRIGAAARARIETEFALPRMLRDYCALLSGGSAVASA
jgi:glycosyltransferase involved in cell wall biosynthesis